MQSIFQELKAGQSAAIFAKRAGGSIKAFYISRLMYYLEREIIIRTGQPLFYVDLVTTTEGTSPVQIDAGIQSILSNDQSSPWTTTFKPKGESSIRLVLKPGDDRLSISDSNMIYEIYEIFEKFT